MPLLAEGSAFINPFPPRHYYDSGWEDEAATNSAAFHLGPYLAWPQNQGPANG